MTLVIGNITLSFENYVNAVFEAWPGYQVALRQQTGGAQTKEKDQWLRSEFSRYLLAQPIPQLHDVVNWLETILDEEFNLILEDDSINFYSADFVKASEYFRNGNSEGMKTLLEKIPKNKEWIKITKALDGQDSTSSESESDESMDDDDNAGNSFRRQPRMITDDDGWTTIQSRR